MDNVVIRQAKPQDARQIQEIIVQGWNDTYPNAEAGITAEDIDAFFADAFSNSSIKAWEQELDMDDKNKITLVAEDGDNIVAVCRGFVREEYNQVQMLYVRRSHRGNKIGVACIDAMQPFFSNGKDVVIQVAEYNTSARKFYEKLGFRDTGKRFMHERFKMPVSGKSIPEMEMRKKTGLG